MFNRLKQRGEKIGSKFVVNAEMSSHIDKYLLEINTAFGDAIEGQLIKGTPVKKSGSYYVNQNMGRNTMSEVGKDIAGVLNLENPSQYTSHCFRRSAATIAVENGATTQELINHFGWSTEKTAERYVDNTWVLANKMAGRYTIQNSTTTINATIGSPSQKVSKLYNITAEAGSTLNFN